MNKETFAWIALGFGVGLLAASAIMYISIQEERSRTQDPRLAKAEALLDEAESLLKSAKKS
jgi:hypothetical protein